MVSTFGEKLKAIRKSKGMTQRQLADEAGLSISTIRQFEQRGGDPALSTVYAIADVLMVPPCHLIERD